MKTSAIMRTRHKILAVLLTMLVAVAFMPAGAFAAESGSLADGVYQVPVDLWNAGGGSASMGNGALCGSSSSKDKDYKPRLVVKDGKGTLIVKFMPIYALNSTGFLYTFTSATSGISNPQVITKYMKTDGSIYFDMYNNPDTGSSPYIGNAYPKLMAVDVGKIPSSLVTPENVSDMIKMAVDVPPMGTNSKQNVMLKIGWSDIKAVNDLSSDVEYWVITALNMKKQGSMTDESWNQLQSLADQVRTKLENETIDMEITESGINHKTNSLTDSEKKEYSTQLCSLIEKLKTEADPAAFENFKTEYKTKLENYKNKDNYREAQQSEIADIVSEAKAAIDAADNVADVMSIASEAMSKLDEVKTDEELTKIETENFDAYKKEAVKTLESYSEKENLKKYRTEQQNSVKAKVVTGKKNINNSQTVSEVDAALKAAIEKIEAIKTDLQLTREELQSSIDEAAAIEQGSKGKSAYKELQQAIEAARAALDSESTDELNSQKEALQNAVNVFNESDDNQGIDTSQLEDGTYSVDFTMINAANTEQKSMSDGAMVKPAVLKVENGDYTLSCSFQGLTIGNSKGYLKELYYWDGTEYKKTTVEREFNVVDVFNDDNEDGVADYKYPKKLSFPLLGKDKGDDENGYVKLRVFVPIMEDMSAGTGTQNVFMSIDWSSIREGAEEEDETPEDKKSAQVITVSDAQKSVTYNPDAASKTNKVDVSGVKTKATYTKVSGSDALTIDKTSGQISVKKGTAAGTYSIKVKIAAAESEDYLAASSEATVKVVVKKAGQTLKVNNAQKTVTYNAGAVSKTAKVAVSGAKTKVTYAKSSGSGVLTVDKASGQISVKKGANAGTYSIKVKASAPASGNYLAASSEATVKVVVKKASQAIKVNSGQKSVKYSKKKAVTTAKVAVTGAKGKVTYAKVSGDKNLSIGKATGKITVKKGTKKGTHSIKVKVSSGATTNYNAAAKTVTIKVKVK